MQATVPGSNPMNNNNLFETEDAKDIEYGGPEYVFALLGEDFDDIGESDSDDDIALDCAGDWKICPDCNVRMQPMKDSFQCTMCGRDKKVLLVGGEYSTSIIDNYNTNNSGSPGIKITGDNSYKYNKGLYATISSDYKKVQSNNTNRQLNRFNAQSKCVKLPIVILKEATELYCQVQQHIVLRGNGRKGGLGSCISFVCNRRGITKKPKVIAEFLGIDESFLSKGDKKLRSLCAEGKIDIPIHHDPTDDYLLQYFEALSIDGKYKPFMSDVIKRAAQPDALLGNNSRISTRCAGVIYMLSMQENLSISKSNIATSCDISVSTFVRYYHFLMKNRKLLKPIFIKYGIKPLSKKTATKKNVTNMKAKSEKTIIGRIVTI
jgi:transcription initiation factor TFIIIB Brf1 subunit/transcription initiation factor TFIIB